MMVKTSSLLQLFMMMVMLI